jgi:hypothetical protein
MADEMTKLPHIPGVDSQVLTAACEMTEAQKKQPEWLWHENGDDISVSWGRWSSNPNAAPYIRADLVLDANPAAPPVGAVCVPGDGFNGTTEHLVQCIHALLHLDEEGALVPHGIGGHARSLLTAAASRLTPAPPSAVCVPVEPTPEMLRAGTDKLWEFLGGTDEMREDGITATVWPHGCETEALIAYRAMLAAAPSLTHAPPSAAAEAGGEVEELQKTFDLRWNADMRAIERWQAATGQTLTWPDHADLVVWLLEQNDSLRAVLQRLDSYWAEDMPEGPEAQAGFLTPETIAIWQAVRAALNPPIEGRT